MALEADVHREFLPKLAELLDEESFPLRADYALADKLDSFTVLSLIALIEEHYGVTLPSATLGKLETAGQLIEAIEAGLPLGR